MWSELSTSLISGNMCIAFLVRLVSHSSGKYAIERGWSLSFAVDMQGSRKKKRVAKRNPSIAGRFVPLSHPHEFRFCRCIATRRCRRGTGHLARYQHLWVVKQWRHGEEHCAQWTIGRQCHYRYEPTSPIHLKVINIEPELDSLDTYANRVLSTGADPGRFCQVERERGRLVESI